MQETLPAFLHRHGLVAIADIDTRRLTRILRTKGAQNGCIVAGEADEKAALEAARAAPSMAGQDLAKVVTCAARYEWNRSLWALGTGYGTGAAPRRHVVAYDYGVKHNILRHLAERGCHVTVLPAETPAAEALALKPDGVFLSNGPGDPAALPGPIRTIEKLAPAGKPIFGICLGHQLLGLALGAKTFKLKFGHRGANHPVQDLQTGHVAITSQNHGFAVDASALPAEIEATHRNLNDGTLEGFRHRTLPILAAQFHPEAAPGPHDANVLFNGFLEAMARSKS
jgi:carbamoyl-phosphate synthase small subunit